MVYFLEGVLFGQLVMFFVLVLLHAAPRSDDGLLHAAPRSEEERRG